MADGSLFLPRPRPEVSTVGTAEVGTSCNDVTLVRSEER